MLSNRLTIDLWAGVEITLLPAKLLNLIYE